MTSLKAQLLSYGDYHRDPRNKLTHFVGVPLVTFAIFLFLSWFRFVAAPEWPFTGALLFFLVVFLSALSLLYLNYREAFLRRELDAERVMKAEELSRLVATLAHEMTHWTGHPGRVPRKFPLGGSDTSTYAREELVAELGAAYLCADLGLSLSNSLTFGTSSASFFLASSNCAGSVVLGS